MLQFTGTPSTGLVVFQKYSVKSLATTHGRGLDSDDNAKILGEGHIRAIQCRDWKNKKTKSYESHTIASVQC